MTLSVGRPAAGSRMFRLPPGWWPVIFGSELGRHPSGVVLGGRTLALYRDGSGRVRAVDDVCPHRRMPLSLGRITEDSQLQCAYHGWCFDGATGQCTKIPNFAPNERVKPHIKVAAFATAEAVVDALGWQARTALAPAVGPPTGEEPEGESTTMFAARLSHGLVLVWTGEDSPGTPPVATTRNVDAGPTFQGKLELRAPYEVVMRGLVVNPGRVLCLEMLLGAGEELMTPQVNRRGGTLVVRRERRTLDLPQPHGFRKLDWDWRSIEISMNATTGLTGIRVLGPESRCSARVTVGLTPVSEYRTVLRWRVEMTRTASGLVRRFASVRGLPGMATARGERACDEAFDHADAATRRLDSMRAGHPLEFSDAGNPSEGE